MKIQRKLISMLTCFNQNTHKFIFSFDDHLEVMFNETAPWDKENKYNKKSIRVINLILNMIDNYLLLTKNNNFRSIMKIVKKVV